MVRLKLIKEEQYKIVSESKSVTGKKEDRKKLKYSNRKNLKKMGKKNAHIYYSHKKKKLSYVPKGLYLPWEIRYEVF